MSFKAFELAPVIEKVVTSSTDRPKTVRFRGFVVLIFGVFCVRRISHSTCGSLPADRMLGLCCAEFILGDI